MDTFCQSSTTTNIQGKIVNVPNKRQIPLNIMAEMIKIFKGLTLDSTINNSKYYHFEEDDAESDPNSDPKVNTTASNGKKRKVTDTDTTNRNYSHRLLINLLIPETIPFVIPPIYQTIAEDYAGSGDTFHARRKIL